MQNIFAFLVLILWHSNVNGQSSFWAISPFSSDISKEKGDIESYMLIEYEAIDYFGQLKKINEDNRTDVFFFDDKNRFIKSTRTENGKIGRTITASYFNGDEIARIKYYENGELNISEYKYKFDDRGNIIEYNRFRNDTLIHKEIDFFDQNDSLVEHREYGEDGKLGWKRNWVFDFNGNITEEKHWNNYGYFSHHTFEYSNNKKIKAAKFSLKGEKVQETKYSYDETDKLLFKIITYFESADYNREFQKKTYKYNSQGKIIEEKLYGATTLSNLKPFFDQEPQHFEKTEYDSKNRITLNENEFGKKTYRYDASDNLIQTERYHFSTDDFSKYTSSYEYDSKGNWTKEINTYKFEGTSTSDTLGVKIRIFTYR
jgi:hypothetical protein